MATRITSTELQKTVAGNGAKNGVKVQVTSVERVSKSGHHAQPEFIDLSPSRVAKSDRPVESKDENQIIPSGDAGKLSVEQLTELVEKYPETPGALNFGALGFFHKGMLGRAERIYRRSLAIDPENASSYNGLGNTIRYQGRYAEALGFFEKGLKFRPKGTGLLVNQALTYLSLGEYRRAWDGYEHRLHVIDRHSEVLKSGKPCWNGEEMGSDETLYLYGNQGLGDELMCIRFLPEVVRRVKNVVLEVQPPLYELMKDFPGLAEVIPYERDRSVAYDKYCEVFSLPRVFHLESNDIPDPVVPNFARDEAIISLIAEERRKAGVGVKHVGLVWSGNPKNDINIYRACGLDRMRTLLDVPNCRFYSLQKGVPRVELENNAELQKVIFDLAPHLSDMSVTATAIQELDLVITVDTSIPHLTGTLQEPGWVMVHTPADWRWNLDTEKSPWYPSLRVFTQESARQWDPVLEKVRSELYQFSQSKK